jgi:hypothetical protein
MTTENLSNTVTLSAAELNVLVACLHDNADIQRSGLADELLRDKTADYSLVDDLADKLEHVLKPEWNPDEI